MKKLMYNKNTKEIDIADKDDFSEKKKPRRVKTWLENNKIFFEIFSFVFVGVMGIVISFVGWKTNERSASIYQRQLEILDNDREPYFTIDCEKIIDRFESKDNYFIKNLYKIKNEGGLINGAFLYGVRGYATIFLTDTETKTEKIYNIYIPEMFEVTDGSMSLYDDENRNFCFYGYGGSKYDDFRTQLNSKLNELFDGYTVGVYFENYVYIVYVNYKNEECSHTYKFLGDRLTLFTGEKERTFIGTVENIEDVDGVAKNIYGLIMEKEENEK